jgi:glycosyltransferase involved in cell wall biosynthesis
LRIAIISSQVFSLLNFRGALIVDLVAAGVEVFAFAPDFDPGTRKRIEELGAYPMHVSLNRTSLNVANDVIAALKLSRCLRGLKVDASLAYFVKPVIFGTLAARIAGVKKRYAIIEGLGFVYSRGSSQSSIKKYFSRMVVNWLYKFALIEVERVFFLNSIDRAEFVSLKIVRPAKTVLLPGIGVDLNFWSFSEPVFQPISFLLAARLLREKGVLEFVSAARRIKITHPTTRFILLGCVDSNPNSFSVEEINAWVSEGLIEWPGFVDVKPWLKKTSVFVLPSYYREGVPRSTQEALAMGKPVITTDWTGCRDTVVEGVNGFLVPPRDVDAIVQAMQRFLERPELINEMGLRSRALAEKRFDVSKINLRFLEVLGVMSRSVPKSLSSSR